MRDVAAAWPAAASELHHSFGVWPALIDDKTIVEVWDPPHRLVLRARGWPIGEARVTIQVKPRGAESVVCIHEEPIAGPGRYLPRPLLDLLLHWRNTETLHRLAYLAEGKAATIGPSTAEEERAAENGASTRLEADIDPDEVNVLPGTGGPDDAGDIEVGPDEVDIPRRQR
jgi:hypothetical protein